MKVLFVASEAFPFAKSGGLGDVIGSLPMALNNEKVKISVMIPKYQEIPQAYREQMTRVSSFSVQIGWRNQECTIDLLAYKNVDYYFIGSDYYFNRQGMYGFYDEAERFSFFCRGVLEALPHLQFRPDIIHCHDWHTGMISVFLKAHYQHNAFYQGIKTVYTIHNLKFQGIFPKEILGQLLELDESYFTIDGVEFHNNVSFMKGGLVYSDRLTTVSPTYAEEIQTQFYGEGLEGLLFSRREALSGILNGIDGDEFNPETDPYIIPYDGKKLKTKQRNKRKLQQDLGLMVDEQVPIVAIVSRLTPQKGLDLIAHVMDELLQLDLQLVVLGTGDKEYENLFHHTAQGNPSRVSAQISFNNELAHRIYAGSDLFLMPSLFEPCGIGQLIALKYGSLPIVRETGGLRDTVIPYNEFTKKGNGFSFTNYNAHDMLYTINKAINFYHNKRVWNHIVRSAMNTDCSWNVSAKAYIGLYKELLGDKRRKEGDELEK